MGWPAVYGSRACSLGWDDTTGSERTSASFSHNSRCGLYDTANMTPSISYLSGQDFAPDSADATRGLCSPTKTVSRAALIYPKRNALTYQTPNIDSGLSYILDSVSPPSAVAYISRICEGRGGSDTVATGYPFFLSSKQVSPLYSPILVPIPRITLADATYLQTWTL